MIIIKDTGKRTKSGGHIIWLCKCCECGELFEVPSYNFNRKNLKICDCLSKKKEEMIGIKFGRYTVVDYIKKERGSYYWLCSCDCGNKFNEVMEQNLLNGTSQSCGCLAKEKFRARRLVDITGQKFGRLTALERVTKKGQSKWLCECDCGNYKIIEQGHLTNGSTKSCGCLQTKDIAGNIFGMLTVIERVYLEDKLYSYWLCKCECGNEKILKYSNLMSGATQSCGCLKNKIIDELMIGNKFGKLLVLERGKNENNESYWICRCDCGNYTETRGTSLTTGQTQSCGCFQKERASETHFVDITGNKYGKLIVLQLSKEKSNGGCKWICECDCGNITIVSQGNLVSGHTSSCGCLNRRRGEDNPLFRGIRPLSNYLRTEMCVKIWRDNTVKRSNYKCVITGKPYEEIHHIYPFYLMVDELLDITQIPFCYTVDQYTIEELTILANEFSKIQDKYGLGVCLIKDLHDEFHAIYGRIDFTPEDFYEFYIDKTGKNFLLCS